MFTLEESLIVKTIKQVVNILLFKRQKWVCEINKLIWAGILRGDDESKRTEDWHWHVFSSEQVQKHMLCDLFRNFCIFIGSTHQPIKHKENIYTSNLQFYISSVLYSQNRISMISYFSKIRRFDGVLHCISLKLYFVSYVSPKIAHEKKKQKQLLNCMKLLN